MNRRSRRTYRFLPRRPDRSTRRPLDLKQPTEVVLTQVCDTFEMFVLHLHTVMFVDGRSKWQIQVAAVSLLLDQIFLNFIGFSSF